MRSASLSRSAADGRVPADSRCLRSQYLPMACTGQSNISVMSRSRSPIRLRVVVWFALLISAAALAQTATPAGVQPIDARDESPRMAPNYMSGLRRVAILAVRYVPERSEAYAQARSVRRETEAGTAVGGVIGMGAGAASCATVAWLPQSAVVCFVAASLWSGVGSVAGGILANSLGKGDSTSSLALGAHVTVAASLPRTGDPGPDDMLREEVRVTAAALPARTFTLLDIKPHPAVEVDYRKFASTTTEYDAVLELTVLGLYLVAEAPGGAERFVLPVRARVVRLSDLRVLADIVLTHSTEERSPDDWRTHDAGNLRMAVAESSRVVGQRIVSQLLVGNQADVVR